MYISIKMEETHLYIPIYMYLHVPSCVLALKLLVIDTLPRSGQVR